MESNPLDRVVRGTIDLHFPHRASGKSVDGFSLPRPRLDSRERRSRGQGRHPKPYLSKRWITEKRRSGLSAEKRVSRAPADKASPKATGRIRVILRPDASWDQCLTFQFTLSSERKAANGRSNSRRYSRKGTQIKRRLNLQSLLRFTLGG